MPATGTRDDISNRVAKPKRRSETMRTAGPPLRPVCSVSAFSQQIHHLTGIGKPSRLPLRKNQIVAVFNLEHAASRSNQFRVNPQLLIEFLRQTDGSGLIVSLAAVRDFADIHVVSPSRESASRVILIALDYMNRPRSAQPPVPTGLEGLPIAPRKTLYYRIRPSVRGAARRRRRTSSKGNRSPG